MLRKRSVLAGQGCFQCLDLSLSELGPSGKQKAPKALCLIQAAVIKNISEKAIC